MSRVDAVRIAVEKARAFQPELLAGCGARLRRVLPVRRRPRAGDRGGVAAIIQPGGSVRDEDVVAAVDAAGMAMVATDSAPLPPLTALALEHDRAERRRKEARPSRQAA